MRARCIAPRTPWLSPAMTRTWAPGSASRWWLHHSLEALRAALAERGLPLVIRRGESLAALRALAAECGATAVFWSRLYEPATMARDARVKAALREDLKLKLEPLFHGRKVQAVHLAQFVVQ